MPALRPAPDPNYEPPEKPPKLTVKRNSASAIAICREKEVAQATYGVIEMLEGMVAMIQQDYGLTPEGRLAFAKDEKVHKLLCKIADYRLEYMNFGYAKQKAIEFVGDGPGVAAVQNIIDIRLNVHEPAGRATNGHDPANGPLVELGPEPPTTAGD